MKVILISGKAQHGKDTCGNFFDIELRAKGFSTQIMHFGDALKYVCSQYYNWNGEKDEAGRTLLQYIGTDVVGAKNPAYWAEFVVGVLSMFENEWDYVLIPDCRYPIEVDTVKKKFNTTVLRVFRPDFDNGLTETQKNHPSEVDMDTYDFDFALLNNSTVENFREKLIWFADNYLGEI
jgi:hypothetical protein